MTKIYYRGKLYTVYDRGDKMTQTDIIRIRQSVNRHIGSKIKISANKGRQKFVITEGIIKEAYPNLFLVEIISHKEEETAFPKMVSFSYQDIITKDVRMMLCS